MKTDNTSALGLSSKKAMIGLALAVALMTVGSDALPAPGGTSILHFTFQSNMTNTGVDPVVAGTLNGELNRQGNANNQQLTISLAHLSPLTTYQLAAVIGDEADLTTVAELLTDSKGAVKVAYSQKTQGNAIVEGVRVGKQSLPDALNPLTNVGELDVVNGSSQVVLRADLTDPDKLQYLFKRRMDNTGFLAAADGSLQIQANGHSTKFRLTVSGLAPSTNYTLTLNGNAVQNVTSSGAGKLDLRALPPGAPNVLDIHSVGLTDTNGNLILTVGGGTGGVGIPLDGQAPVNLRSAGTFAVLAGSTVTNTGATTVNGDLGVSPGTAVTGFPPGTVNGTIHSADGAAAQAQLDLTSAFNDAAGRSVGAMTIAGNLGGRTLTPGLYKSTSSLEISSGDLTLDARGNGNAAFIFQIASTLTTTSGRKVILSGGARAANVFWQVGSSATLGTTSVFKGMIMADQSITLATGATLDGRALARIGAVTLDGNVVGGASPTDTTRPTVSFTVPGNGATDVSIVGSLAATFSEAMDPLTITTATFKLMQGATPVTGTVSYTGVTATFTPNSALAPGTTYTATISTGARDLAGNALAADFVWNFTTSATVDNTAPTVSFTVPVNAATGVAIGGNIAVAFSEAMDPLTITTATFRLNQGATSVTGVVTYAGVTATFNPVSALASSTTYTARITTGARDLAGNVLAADFVWSFTTGATADTTRPTVRSTIPANAATDVPIGGNIVVAFSEAMDPLTITTATVTLKQGTTPVTGTVSYAGVSATFNPLSTLAASTTYTATISTGAKDLAGNALIADFVWSFTTGVSVDTTAPEVRATVPFNGATSAGINQSISATFTEPMNPLTINTVTFKLAGQGGIPVTGTVAYDVLNNIATFNPAGTLATLTTYTATITTGAKDLAGNAIVPDVVWTFTTAAVSAGQASVALGAATSFAVLAGSTVTNTGATTVLGDLGVSPGSAVTGFATADGGPGTVNGTIYNVTPGPAASAQSDLTIAFNDAAGRTFDPIPIAGNIGGQTLVPGLYKSISSLEISSGDLTLDGQGNPGAVFIFQIASTLTTTSGRQVILIGGVHPANVFWQVGSSATLGTTTVFKGTIMADQSITLATGATLEGRALARSGAVTLDTNAITIAVP